jgi:putative cell wall-binding protein
MNKAERIAEFIKENNPRRKDIVKFIVVTLNGWDETEYDKNPRRHRGYYSVPFTTWNYAQKVVKCPKTQRYSLTKYYEKYGKLYSMSLEVQLEYSKKRADHLLKLYGTTNRELQKERKKNMQLLGISK